MTDFEILARARMYIDKLANGINPLDDTAVSDDDIINNVRISRCLFYVAGVLDKVIANGGEIAPAKKAKKAEFRISAQEIENFEYSDTPIAISEIVKRINALTENDSMKQLNTKQITAWLVSCGILEEVERNEKVTKYPTDVGLEMGLSIETRVGYRGEYTAVFYNEKAQEFIIDNLETALNFYENERAERYSLAGTPWTDEHKEVLINLFKKGASMTEICVTLKRKRSEIKKQIEMLK